MNKSKTEFQAPVLFDREPIVELLVPVQADRFHERGVSIASRYAETWGLPVRLVHVAPREEDVLPVLTVVTVHQVE